MNSRALSRYGLAAAGGFVASAAVGEPALAEAGPTTDPAGDFAYQLGRMTPAICCGLVLVALIAVLVILLVRRSNRR